MRTGSLSEAARVYECSERSVLRSHEIFHLEFRNFCFAMRKLRRRVFQAVPEDGFWKAFLFPLKRYAFLLSSSPLPFNHPGLLPARGIDGFKDRLADARFVYPQIAPIAEEVIGRLCELIVRSDNPGLEMLEGSAWGGTGAQLALLIHDSNLVTSVEQELARHTSLKQIRVVNVYQLRSDSCYDGIAIMGASSWYPDYVFASPRAPEIHLIRYRWIRESVPSTRLFVLNEDKLPQKTDIRSGMDPAAEMLEESVNAEEMLSFLDIEELCKNLTRSAPERSGIDVIESRLAVLDGRAGVFLASDSTVLVIDLREDEAKRVSRVPMAELEPGMFILLRTEGGGDLVVPVADRILGKQAHRAREIQRLWKEQLKDAVRTSSLLEVSLKLLDLGSIRAHEGNVRNWMSERNIKSEDSRDFEAIMKLVGLADKAREYWGLMVAIDRAHLQAGGQIRRLLLKRVLQSDLSQLDRMGRMEFELAEADGGSLTAFRIEKLHPETFKVPETREGRLFDLAQASWQG